MALTIELNNNINNTSLQIGDVAYWVHNVNTASPIIHSNSPLQKIGEITASSK